MSTTPPSDPWGQPGGNPPGGYPPGGGPGYPPPPGPGGYPPPPGGPGYPPPQGPGPYPPPPQYGGYPQQGWQGQGGGTGGYLAGWWYRVGATIIDAIIVGIVAVIIDVAGRVTGAAFSGVDSLLNLAYAIVLIGSTRARTFGMMFVGTRVVDSATGGQPGYGKAAVRALVQLVLGITIIGGILDIFWPLWDRQNQTLHDKAAGTVLLRA